MTSLLHHSILGLSILLLLAHFINSALVSIFSYLLGLSSELLVVHVYLISHKLHLCCLLLLLKDLVGLFHFSLCLGGLMLNLGLLLDHLHLRLLQVGYLCVHRRLLLLVDQLLVTLSTQV